MGMKSPKGPMGKRSMGSGYLATGKRHNPPGIDKSMGAKGPSVNSDATRGGVAPSPKTLGGRTA